MYLLLNVNILIWKFSNMPAQIPELLCCSFHETDKHAVPHINRIDQVKLSSIRKSQPCNAKVHFSMNTAYASIPKIKFMFQWRHPDSVRYIAKDIVETILS